MKIVLIATNANTNMGGEAIKAIQYFEYLLAKGYDVLLLTHARSRGDTESQYPEGTVAYIEDSPLQIFCQRRRLLKRLVPLIFHRNVARFVRRFDPASTILHYIAPVSPVVPRLPPRGYKVVMGPFTGNIYYPPAFRERMPAAGARAERWHKPMQRLLSIVMGDKRRADRILVSGYERTRQSLLWAGTRPERLIDVVDAGVPDALSDHPRLKHAGRNPRFICTGRHDNHKGIDFAIRALRETAEDVSLTVLGKGVMTERLKAIARDCGVEARVDFRGWLPHGDIYPVMREHRGFIFPSLAEANGIVVQEAMMMGLPVVTLDWGGPAELGDNDCAFQIEPLSEAHVVSQIARAMDTLASDPERADRMAAHGREIAEARFRWDTVAHSWASVYAELLPA